MNKIKNYNDIQPNNHRCYEVIYYNISKTLHKMETPMIKACCNNKTIESLELLRLLVEQMVSKYKGNRLIDSKRKEREEKRRQGEQKMFDVAKIAKEDKKVEKTAQEILDEIKKIFASQ